MIEYLKLNRNHVSYDRDRAAAEKAFREHYPDNVFSENVSLDGRFSWCKTVKGNTASSAVVDRCFYDDRSKLLSDVLNPAWEPVVSLFEKAPSRIVTKEVL